MIVSSGDMSCFDPWQTLARVTLQWQRQLQDSLVYEDTEGDFHPWLAADFTVNDDATEFTFTLRDDVTFSDGSSLDAETVKANLDALKAEPAYTIASNYLTSYEGTTVVDERTAVVSFSAPNASFLFGLSIPNLSMTSAESAAIPAADRCAGSAAGSGPFSIESSRSGEQVVLAANTDYAWGPAALSNTGAPYLDTITINQVADTTVIGQSGLAGEADIIQQFADAELPALEQAGWTHFDQPDPATAMSFIIYPGRGVLGNDDAAREAFRLALDRDELLAASTLQSEPTNGVLNSAHPFTVDQTALMIQDLDQANKVLDDAGWVPGSDGIRVKDGERLSVESIMYAGALPDIAAVAAQQLSEVGIELLIRPVTFAEETSLRAEGQIPMRLNALTGAEPTVLGGLFDGDLPPGVAEQLAAQGATTDRATRQAAVEELASILLEGGWQVPLFQYFNQPWWASRVHGTTRDVGGLFMMSQIWLDPAE